MLLLTDGVLGPVKARAVCAATLFSVFITLHDTLVWLPAFMWNMMLSHVILVVFVLKMESVYLYETLVNTYKCVRYYDPEHHSTKYSNFSIVLIFLSIVAILYYE